MGLRESAILFTQHHYKFFLIRGTPFWRQGQVVLCSIEFLVDGAQVARDIADRRDHIE